MSELRQRLDQRYRALFGDPFNVAFFGGSGYANYGLWAADTNDATAACHRLVDTLLHRLPTIAGPVLDVACGLGATTARIAARGRAVVGLDLGAVQVRAARQRAGVQVVQADAAHLPFADHSFAGVMSVEAAFHFETRAAFLAEAMRVLRPGGGLVLADVLCTETAGRVPPANFVASIADYRKLLAAAGFEAIAVDDVLAPSWGEFKRRYARFVLGHFWRPRFWRGLPELLRVAATRYSVTNRAMLGYLLVSARKPSATETA